MADVIFDDNTAKYWAKFVVRMTLTVKINSDSNLNITNSLFPFDTPYNQTSMNARRSFVRMEPLALT